MKSNSLQGGFSLLELLTTLAIFSGLMTLLLNSMHQLSLQNDKVKEVLSLRQEARSLENVIKQDLLNSVYLKNWMVKDQRSPDDRRSGIYGINVTLGDVEADKLHLHVVQPSKNPSEELQKSDPLVHEVSYYLEEIPNKPKTYRLIRREEFYLDHDMTDGNRSIRYSLTERIQHFELLYFDTEGSSFETEWDPREKEKRPAAIKVRFSLKNKEGRIETTTFQVNLMPQMGSHVKWADNE